MTRTILATATALVAAATLFTSAAEACISCEYTPEVVRSSSTLPHTGHYYSARPYEKKEYAPAKRRVVKSEPVVKLNTAKVERAGKVEKKVAKIERAEPKAEKVAKAEPTETKAVDSESSSISLASNDAAAPEKAPVAKVEKEAAAKPTDCKKFFASVGMTLTVPCEQ
ncbi:MAG TPA: hypothetical protein VIG38_07290 [Hyphomicrobium sp.]